MRAERRARLQIHLCVLLWGFTAILGKLITLSALDLVWRAAMREELVASRAKQQR